MYIGITGLKDEVVSHLRTNAAWLSPWWTYKDKTQRKINTTNVRAERGIAAINEPRNFEKSSSDHELKCSPYSADCESLYGISISTTKQYKCIKEKTWYAAGTGVVSDHCLNSSRIVLQVLPIQRARKRIRRETWKEYPYEKATLASEPSSTGAICVTLPKTFSTSFLMYESMLTIAGARTKWMQK